jgi:hypothetical protein
MREIRISALTIVPLLLASVVAAAGKPPNWLPNELNDIRAAIATEAARVESIRLAEVVEISNKELPGWTQRFRQQQAEAIAAMREGMLETVLEASSNGELTDDARAGVEKVYERDMAQVPDIEAVFRLNRDFSIDRTRTVDFVLQRKRLDDTDRRNLDELMEAAAMAPAMRINVSRSKTLVLDATQSVRMPAAVPDLAVISPVQTFDADAEYLSLGIVPDSMFSHDFDLAMSPSKVGVDIQAKDRQTGAMVFSFTVSPARNYRLITWTTFAPDGAGSNDMEFGDYRKVGDTWIPFSTRTSHSKDGVPDAFTQTTTVQRAEINPKLTDDMFSIPEGMRIQDLSEAWHR